MEALRGYDRSVGAGEKWGMNGRREEGAPGGWGWAVLGGGWGCKGKEGVVGCGVESMHVLQLFQV